MTSQPRTPGPMSGEAPKTEDEQESRSRPGGVKVLSKVPGTGEVEKWLLRSRGVVDSGFLGPLTLFRDFKGVLGRLRDGESLSLVKTKPPISMMPVSTTATINAGSLARFTGGGC